MLHFDTDYMRGACEEIIQKLVTSNFEQTVGYGLDEYCKRAKELILEACGLEKGDVHFLVGGTQTNATVIDGLLSKHQGVLAADTGHINVHEKHRFRLGQDNTDGSDQIEPFSFG
jgi:threonine aldolase